MTPQRLIVTPMRGGARQIILARACVKVGRLFAAWEDDREAIAQLKADHRKRAPACRHPEPMIGARP